MSNKTRKTVYQNEAIIFVNDERLAFTGNKEEAEKFITDNLSDYSGDQIEIYLRYKTFNIKAVSTIKIEEV